MKYTKITSVSNPLVKEALKLKDRKTEDRRDFFIEGQHLLEMAIVAKIQIKQVFFTSHFKSGSGVFLEDIRESGCRLIETTEHILSKLSDTETPQGIAAVVSYKTYDLGGISLRTTPLFVVCDGIQDPGNLGTIIRTSDAFDADAVILLPGTCDALAPKVVRASAGSIFNLPVFSVRPDMLIEWLHSKAIELIVTEVRAPRTIYESDLRKSIAFVFGNEARGVSENMKEKEDLSLSIFMPGKAESLNVATSAAICLYETFRQRKLQT